MAARALPTPPRGFGTRVRGWGVRVYVDPKAPLIDGTTVDFKQNLNEAFRFQNPNIRGECGRGSFAV
jgi:Fe-S cluster assembly iron-binding protein IscA